MAYTGVSSEGISKAAVAPNAHGQASEEETSANSTTRDDPNIAHPAGPNGTGESQSSQGSSATACRAGKWHRSFPRFPNSHPEIKKFLQFLRGLDGRRKSTNESLQVATDVSKYLKYASPSSDNPNWLLLLDNRKARGYINMLNDTGACGASGQLTKLDRLLHTLRYLRLEVAARGLGSGRQQSGHRRSYKKRKPWQQLSLS